MAKLFNFSDFIKPGTAVPVAEPEAQPVAPVIKEYEYIEREYIERNDAIKRIKTAFKSRGLSYSVTGGRGTAWGWITIDLLPSVYKSLDEAGRKAAYLKLGADLGKENGYTSESIPASNKHYQEYIDRANGITPTVLGEVYWD